MQSKQIQGLTRLIPILLAIYCDPRVVARQSTVENIIQEDPI